MQDAFDRTKGDVQDQVDALRQQSRALTDQARENFERARAEAEKRIGPDGAGQPNGDELESARKEIRDLQQQLQRATRRLEALSAAAVAPEPCGTPRAKPADGGPQSSRSHEHTTCGTCTPRDTGKASRTRDTREAGCARDTGPAGATERATSSTARPDPDQAPDDHGPQLESDERLHKLEDKMDRLLKAARDLETGKEPQGEQVIAVRQRPASDDTLTGRSLNSRVASS